MKILKQILKENSEVDPIIFIDSCSRVMLFVAVCFPVFGE